MSTISRLKFFTSDRPVNGLRGALGMGHERDIVAFLNFGAEGDAFEGFRGDMTCFVANSYVFYSWGVCKWAGQCFGNGS